MRAKLKEIKEELRRRMHHHISEQGKWLGKVVRGYFAYHAVPNNIKSLGAFRQHVMCLWLRTHAPAVQPEGLFGIKKNCFDPPPNQTRTKIESKQLVAFRPIRSARWWRV